jgi:hypothetical protein
MNAIQKTLNLNKIEYNETIIECFDTELTEEEFTLCINKSDIIIMNLIEDNYRNKKYLSTTHVIYHSQKDCKIIILNNFYFHFYYFDSKMINIKNSYNHLNLYECYKNNKTVDLYINNYINNSNLKTKYELEYLANKSFEELDTRYEHILLHKQMSPHKLIYSIPISNYIKDNYKKKLLFYTTNHPSKYLFQYVSEKIISILNLENTIDYSIDLLSHTKLILYKCIQRVVLFDIQIHRPLIGNQSNINDIYQWYCDLYKNTNIEL